MARAPHHRFLAASVLRSVEKHSDDQIILTGSANGAAITQTVTLKPDSDHVHIRIDLALDEPELEYILSSFVFKAPNPPEFIHTPNLKYSDDDIIGDRVFHSPAIIMQQEALFCALVPDLDLINEYPVIAPGARTVATGHAFCIPLDQNTLTMPTGMDVHLRSGLTEDPLLAYGVIDSIATHHMHWRHPSDGSMVRRLNSLNLCYGFDLFVSADAPRFRGYQRITRHLWERYGSQYLSKPRPQAMPLADYARVCYPAGWAYQGSDVVLIDGIATQRITHRRDSPTSTRGWNGRSRGCRSAATATARRSGTTTPPTHHSGTTPATLSACSGGRNSLMTQICSIKRAG